MVPFNRGIATPVCALARNDSVYLVRTFEQQFVEQLRKADKRIPESDLFDLVSD